MPKFDIYYHDLNEQSKKDLLFEMNFKTERECLLSTNWDIIPFATIELEENKDVHPNQLSFDKELFGNKR